MKYKFKAADILILLLIIFSISVLTYRFKDSILDAFGDARSVSYDDLSAKNPIIIFSISEWMTPVVVGRNATEKEMEDHISYGNKAVHWLGQKGFIVIDERALKARVPGAYLTPDKFEIIKEAYGE